ncbi:sugar ABC transporter substrate-binding protein [Oscillochloris sp. ZM17-4]|uniref:ABC transporter substrate-binding protein n=1 Tax=Oscillochloris sp. ZM17-4 TaxID=2866714 RepID=UPI001C733184|nr:sugar ABC transporter substrate-binding protein [Oscillochloris sp. ZM17-4]MBX0327465.1 sugar ABC transporter substrate-binding protein [Oscillochloris sp. ZM17-4]
MYWKRSLTIFSLLMIIATMLAACGASTTPQGGAAAPAAPAATTAPAAPAAATVRWRTRPGDAAEQKVYEELNTLANDQLKDKGISVTYDPAPNNGDYFTKIQTELAAGNAPDIFWIGGANLADFVNTGQILDLKPLMDKDSSFKIGDFYDNVIGELTRDGKIYGLPRDISTMVVYYNEDMFKAAGLQTPKELAAAGNWNLDTLLDTAKKLTDPAKQQYGLGFGNWWGPGWGYFVNVEGGSPLTPDRKGCGLNTPEAIAGAAYAQNLYNEKLLPAGDADGEALFSAGNVGMYFNGRWFAPGVRTNAKFNWDVAPMPKGKVESTWLFWGPYLVNAKTANPDATWEVLKVLTSAEATGKVAALGTNVPPRKDAAAVNAFLGATPPANNQAYLDGISYAALEAPVWDGNWGDFSGKVQSLWDQMIAGQITPEEFGNQACEQTADTFTK